MLRYIVGRLLSAVPILLLVAVFIFSLVHLTPGDPAVLLAGDNARPEQVEQIRARPSRPAAAGSSASGPARRCASTSVNRSIRSSR